MTTTAPQPGIHLDVPFDEYASWPYMSNSKLGLMERCPAKLRHHLDTGDIDETPPLRFGSAEHAAVLEPQRFDRDYAIGPADQACHKCDPTDPNCPACMGTGRTKLNKATTIGKELWAKFEADNPGKTLLPAAEAADVKAMRTALFFDERNHKAQEVLKRQGRAEVSVIWDDEIHGERCKGRLDYITAIDGYSSVVDLKCVADAQRRVMSSKLASYGYHRQAAMYLDALAALDHLAGRQAKRRRYVFLVGEKSPPWIFSLYELDQESLRSGRILYRALLRHYQMCRDKNNWPGYTNGQIESVSIPRWAMMGDDNDRY